MNLSQKKAHNRHDNLDKLLLKGAKLVRLHTSGDFFTSDGNNGYMLDMDYINEVIEWCRTNSDITVWAYTHDVKKLIEAGLSYVNNSFPDNLHILASVENLIERVIAKSNGYKTAQVIESVQDKDSGTTLCPFDLEKSQKNTPKSTCAKCTLCFNKNHKNDIALIRH